MILLDENEKGARNQHIHERFSILSILFGQIKNFRDYVDLFVKNKEDENEQPLKVVYESVNDRSGLEGV